VEGETDNDRSGFFGSLSGVLLTWSGFDDNGLTGCTGMCLRDSGAVSLMVSRWWFPSLCSGRKEGRIYIFTNGGKFSHGAKQVKCRGSSPPLRIPSEASFASPRIAGVSELFSGAGWSLMRFTIQLTCFPVAK